MKHFFLASLFPAVLTAQTMQLTGQLGKTVLYDAIALSPDSAHVAWVQSTAATTSKQTYVRGILGSAPAAMVNIASTGERKDSSPAWATDSKRLAVSAAAGDKAQEQLWTVNADGSHPQNLTHLNGYAGRPCWSRHGKQIGMVRPTRTGRISIQMCKLLRMRTISIHRPELRLVFLSGCGKNRERFGIGRPSRA